MYILLLNCRIIYSSYMKLFSFAPPFGFPASTFPCLIVFAHET